MDIKSEDDRRVLIFQHIPKTAGSTLHNILNKRYRNKYSIFSSSLEDDEAIKLRELGEERLLNIDLLKGHMPFGLHQYMPRPAYYFTMLRDPVKRVISQYFYIKKNIKNPLHNEVVSKNLSLGQLIESGISVGLNNGQVRWLSGDLKDIPFGEVTTARLELAIENINKHFILVGINEMFDQSILLLAHKLGWKSMPYYDRVNINKKKSSVSDEDIEIITHYNQLDLLLYNRGRELMHEEMRMLEGFEDTLERFKKWNQYYAAIRRPLRLLNIIK